MYKPLFLFLLVAAFFSSCSNTNTNKDGAPNEKGARDIVKNWFDERNRMSGGAGYEPESFDIVSVSGDAKKATIIFKWSGLLYPPSIPDIDHSPSKVKDKQMTLTTENKNGKWGVTNMEQ